MTGLSLRVRTLLIIGLTLLALFAFLYQISSAVLLENSAQLEKEQVESSLAQVRAVLEQELAESKQIVQDYAWWDETYRFIEQRDPAYLDAHLPALSMANLDVDLLVILDAGRAVVFSGLLNERASTLSPLSPDMQTQVQDYLRQRAFSGPEDTVAGLILLEANPVMLMAAPILTNHRTGPSRGVMIMGRYLNEQRIKHLSEIIRMPSLLLLDVSASRGWFPEPIQPVNERLLYGLVALNDLNGERIGTLRVELDRPIYQQGLKSRQYLLVNLAVVGLICAAIVLWLLERLVLGRLVRFDEILAAISRTQDSSLRLPVKDGDELDRLALTINHMLDSLKETHQRLLHDALHDQLTGLANRMLFMDRLQNAMQQAVRHPEERFALLLVDLDGFKYINDSLGHGAGDEVLVNAARRMEYCIRSSDTLARLGGDEFTIMTTALQDHADALRLAERLLQELQRPTEWHGRTLQVSGSIGITFYTVAYKTADQMLRDADIAMYRAKHSGKNCYQIFDFKMHIAAQARLELENDLRLAVQRNELQVYYQPIVNLKTGEIISFEALARWRHPRSGWVSPQEFIPIAEEIGIVAAIDRWVLTQACRTLKEWRSRFAQGPASVSVNLSWKPFQSADFVAQVLDILASNELSSSDLDLEISESAFGPHKDHSRRVLSELAAAGILLMLDDFGTGYSSLSRLHELPVKILKIDRFFLVCIAETDAKIVSAIISLAHDMGKQVVAEGIETREQLEQLVALGCEYGQGYYFSRPLPKEEASRILAGQIPWGKPT